MKKIAALVDSLTPSQNCFYLVKAFNKAIENTDLSVGVFYNRQSVPIVKPLFGCSMVNFMISYDGVIISTDLKNAEASLKIANKADRYLYLWDLSWLEHPTYFSRAMEVLRNKKIKVIARSESHAQVIENYANIKVCGIVDNWNLEQLIKVV